MGTKHARLSPSTSKRWMICPGSVRLIEDVNIPNVPTKYAAEGTVAHEICEQCLLTGKEPKKFLGKTMEADGFKFKVTQEMIDAVEVYVDYINDHIQRAEMEADIIVEQSVELWCDLTSLEIDGLDGGTTDGLLVAKEHEYIEVCDYKHGKGVAVDAKGNTQMRHYALGALIELGIPKNSDWKVFMTIIQPRAHHPDGSIRTEEVSADDIYKWAEKELVPAAKATREENAPLVPSDEGCRFCDVRGQCSALYEKTQELALLDFEDVSFPDPRLMTSEQKLLIIEHAAALRSFIVAVEEQVRTEANHGSEDYKGRLKLVRTQTRRKFKENALDPIASPLLDHLDYNEVFEDKARGLGDIERALKKAIGKKLAEEVMADITTKPEGDIVIAPMTDKRKEVQPSLTSDFANLDN